MIEEASLKELRSVLQGYEENGHSAKSGDWEIATGGYDLNWQLYYKGNPVVDCIGNSITGSGGTLDHVNMDREDFLKVSKIIKEEYPDVFTKAEEKAELTGLDYKTLWEELGDVPVDENENIDVDWRQFPKGTFREDIWHWFEEEYGISVGELINGEEAVEEMPWEEKGEEKEEGYAFSVTKEGLSKISDYISELEAKRKEILDAGLDTAEEPLPTAADIINDIQFAYDAEFKEYCNGWGVTDEYDADRPLQLELGKDFVKTQVLQVARQGTGPDDDAWVTIKQGNRTGSFVITVGDLNRRKEELEKLEERYDNPGSFIEGKSDETYVEDMIKLGDILDVPNLRELPLIDDQSHALQTAFRKSNQNKEDGCIYIDKDNYQEYLGDIFRDNIALDATFESFVLDFHDDVIRNSVENAVGFPEPEALETGNDAHVTIYPEFPNHFAMRDKGFRDMVRALDECVKEIASDASTKSAGAMTLEEALEKRGIEKYDFMELMHNAAKSKVAHIGTDRVAGLNWDKQQDRKNAEKVLDGWMKKSGKKIAKEIEALEAKEKGEGR